MAAKTIRVTVRTHAILRELASTNVVSIPALLDELVEQYRREQFFLDLEAAYARLRADPPHGRGRSPSARCGEATLADGLDDV